MSYLDLLREEFPETPTPEALQKLQKAHSDNPSELQKVQEASFHSFCSSPSRRFSETKPADTGAVNHWRVHFPNRKPLEIFCSPDATMGQVLADYPAAVVAEAIPDTPKHRLPLSPELESLVRQAAKYYECPPDELELMLEAARNDPEGALTYYQQFAALEVETPQ